MSLILQTTLSPKVDLAECEKVLGQFKSHFKALSTFNTSGMFDEQLQVMAEVIGSLEHQREVLKRKVVNSGREKALAAV